MTSFTGEAGVLVATLDATETYLRTIVSQNMPIGAALRVERNATRGARELLQRVNADHDLELPSGWSEFVEIEEAIDALLARAATPPAPGTPSPDRVRVPHVPPLPDAASHDDPAQAVLEEGYESSYEQAYDSDGSHDAAGADPAGYVSYDEPETPYDEDLGADEHSSYVGYQEQAYVTGNTAPEPAQATYEEDAPSYLDFGEDQGDTGYVDGDYADIGEDLYADTSAPSSSQNEDSYLVFAETNDMGGEDDEDLPSYLASDDTFSLSAEIEAPPAPDDADDDEGEWAFESGGDSSRGAYRLEALPNEEDRVLEFTQDLAGSSVPEPSMDLPSYLASAGDRPELDEDPEETEASRADDPFADNASLYEDAFADDELHEPTQLVSGAPRPHTASIQLGNAGEAEVLGADGAPEPLEVGDAEDWGEEEVDDPMTEGSMTVGVVEYEVEDDAATSATQAATVRDIPTPTDDEIAAMISKAQTTAERDMSEGVLQYGDVLDFDGSCVEAFIARGRLLLHLGDYTAAISDLLKAEAIAPASAEIQATLSELYFTRKDYRRAIQHANAALDLEPTHAPSIHRRGMSQFYRKAYAEAESDLLRAQELDPTLPNVDTYVALARKKQG